MLYPYKVNFKPTLTSFFRCLSRDHHTSAFRNGVFSFLISHCHTVFADCIRFLWLWTSNSTQQTIFSAWISKKWNQRYWHQRWRYFKVENPETREKFFEGTLIQIPVFESGIPLLKCEKSPEICSVSCLSVSTYRSARANSHAPTCFYNSNFLICIDLKI